LENQDYGFAALREFVFRSGMPPFGGWQSFVANCKKTNSFRNFFEKCI
jgi:hypothetical protein